MLQLRALYLFLFTGGIVAAVFVYVAWSTRQARDISYQASSRLRLRFFAVLVLLLSAGLGMTLSKMPYPREGQLPDKVVFAVGKQFAFGLSDKPITNEEELDLAASSPPVEVPAAKLVEFRVTSLDVNHGFSIYTPGGQLIAQTQAMPGYVNRLRVRLSEPGRYIVLCLELCGMEHHSMRAVFDVK